MKNIFLFLFIFISIKSFGQIADVKFDAQHLFLFKSPKEVSDYYGSQNVKTENAKDEEDNVIGMAVAIFPNTNDEVTLVFDSYNSEFTYITFTKNNSQWKFPFNITMGMSLVDLIKINGKEFKISGFEWDYAGGCDWDGGSLHNAGIGIILSPDENSANYKDNEKYKQVMGDKQFSSANEIMKGLGLTVTRIVLTKNAK